MSFAQSVIEFAKDILFYVLYEELSEVVNAMGSSSFIQDEIVCRSVDQMKRLRLESSVLAK